jgi:predicted DCC family thiol-disulfide oxidoreductase YuxK
MTDGKPVLLYDGHCGFCRIWIDYWRQITGDRVEYAASQESADRYPQIPHQAFAEAVQLIRPDGSVASGAGAVFETLGTQRIYHSSAMVRAVTEGCYRFIAQRRPFFYQLTRFTFGTHIEPARFSATQWLFLRLLAIVYAIAFASMGVQVLGLIGSRGILPVRDFLDNVARNFGALRYLAVPTVFWWGNDDTTLVGICVAGVVLAALLILTGFRRGFFERQILILLFVLYLSLNSAGQDFFFFQWDSLLLEAGFLAIFLSRANPASKLIPWMFRWLVFRLYFLSGSVKLLSHDPAWRNLSALKFHYYTQPLPTIFAWYMEQLPQWFHRASTAVVLGVETGVPFLIFAPRRIRILAAFCLLALQVLILLTGNYTFFNLLTIVLTLFLFDDRTLERFVPQRVRQRLSELAPPGRLYRAVAAASAAVILTLGLTRMLETFTGNAPEPLRAIASFAAPLNIVSSYGLFAVMTTTRIEIIVEGSMDGENWLAYEFRYKPGDLNIAPRWVAPHQPRLDWQMWFAALGDYRANPWFVNFALRLLDGSPEVVALLAHNPFPDHPPRYVRAMAYEYTFTDWQTHRRTGAWWKREPRGVYLPAVGLKAASQL